MNLQKEAKLKIMIYWRVINMNQKEEYKKALSRWKEFHLHGHKLEDLDAEFNSILSHVRRTSEAMKQGGYQ